MIMAVVLGTFLDSWILFLLLKNLFYLETDGITLAKFIFLSTLLCGVSSAGSEYFLFARCLNFIIYAGLVRSTLGLDLLRSGFGIVLFYFSVVIADLVSYTLFSGYMGFDLLHVRTMPELILATHLIAYLLSAGILAGILITRSKIRKDRPIPASLSEFIFFYVTGGFISGSIYVAALVNPAIPGQYHQIQCLNISVFLIYILSSLFLVLLNLKFISEKRSRDKLERELQVRRSLEKQLMLYASVDDLTGIYNRRTGLEWLEYNMLLAQHQEHELSICFFDIDNLKVVNDSYGHKEGDKLIMQVVQLIRRHLRKSDLLCRLGGDEFLLILPDCSQAEAENIWTRIKQEMEERNAQHSMVYPISVSHGLARYPASQSLSVDDFINVADRQMYKEKAVNRSRHAPLLS